MILLKSFVRGFILCDFNTRWRQSCRYIFAKSLCLEYCWCWRFIFTNYWCERFTWFYTCSNFTPYVQWIQVKFKSHNGKIKIYLEFKRQTAKYVIWMLRIRVFFAAGIFESLLGSSDFSANWLVFTEPSLVNLIWSRTIELVRLYKGENKVAQWDGNSQMVI